MAKYEILTIVDGKLEEKDANAVNDKLVGLLANAKDLKVVTWGNKTLAYPIKKRAMGYYYIYNFNTDDAKIIAEFRRLGNINPNLLRFMIINLDKDYGARALHNEKKVKKSNLRLQRYEAIQAKKRQEFAAQGGETSLKKRYPNQVGKKPVENATNETAQPTEEVAKTAETSAPSEPTSTKE